MVLRAVLVMAAATFALATAAPADAGSLEDCGQRVIRDWYSGGRVDVIYPLPCYRAAIRALPDDVLQYTDATTVIERALESARQGAVRRPVPSAHETKPAPPSPPSASKPPAAKLPRAASSPPPAAKAPGAAPHPGSTPRDDRARLAIGPTHARAEPGIPYPLIALGALSLVLLASGLAAGLARRRT
jgi:hypothetical protein